jgi:hypothetical protein
MCQAPKGQGPVDAAVSGEDRQEGEAGQEVKSILTQRSISHDEASQRLQRLINSAFHNDCAEQAHFRIPADPDQDDDLVLSAYIEQQRRKPIQ